MPGYYDDVHAYEVFCQVGEGQPLSHTGSVSAPDPMLAWQSAKEVYGRRDDVTVLWVVPRTAVLAQAPEDEVALQARERSPHRQPAQPIKIRKQREATAATSRPEAEAQRS